MNTGCKPTILIACLLGINLLSKNVIAQEPKQTFKIHGVVADSITKKYLEAATVYLLTDSNRVENIAVTTKGAFMFHGSKQLNYKIKITSVGYQTKLLEVQSNDDDKAFLNLDTIYINANTGNLKEVVVTATKPLIKQEIDKISYDMQADPESKGSTVLEMMRKVPYLSIDGDNNILLNGSSSYRIFVNGKPSALVEKNPKDILRSMPASTIKSIEVITNPSSKYDAEGLAGIINIITYKKIDNGYNGTVNVNYKTPVGGPGAGGSFSFKSGRMGVSVLGGASTYNTPQQNVSINRNTEDANTTVLEQNSNRESDSKSRYLASEWSYELDSLRLLSAQFNISRNEANSVVNQQSLLAVKSGVSEGYNLANNGQGKNTGLDAALNYQMGFKKSKERMLTISYRYLRNRNTDFNAVDLFNIINFQAPDYNQLNKGRFAEQTYQVDYVQAIKKVGIEAGIKGIMRQNESDYQLHIFDIAKGFFELDPNRSNNFDNKQNIFSAYNTYQYKTKNWGVKAGLRVEQTKIDANFLTTNTEVKQDYLNVIPAASISRKLKNMSTLLLNYTNRIQRPSIYQLNPFIDRSNPTMESSGNPNLKPGFTNIIQLSYTQSKKAFVNVALAYMLFDDLLNQVSAYDPLTKITRTSFENVGKARILKTNLFINYPVTKDLSLRLNSDIRYIRARFIVGKDIVNNNGMSAYINFSSSYRLQNNWRLNGDITVNSGGIASTQGRTNGYLASTLSVQKDLIKDKLAFSSSISNPFTKYRTVRDKIIGSNFTQITNSEIYYRSFSLSLNYRFGKLKEAVKKNRRGISNDDVELK